MRLRVSIRLTVFFLLVGLPCLLLAHATWFDPRDDYTDQGVSGPYTAIEDGLTTTGHARYLVGEKLAFVLPGQRFTWLSTLCLREDASMLVQPTLVRLRDSAAFPERQSLWTPFDHRCGPLTGSALAPQLVREDGDVAAFQVERRARVRPTSWVPLDAPLRPLPFLVRRPPSPAAPHPGTE